VRRFAALLLLAVLSLSGCTVTLSPEGWSGVFHSDVRITMPSSGVYYLMPDGNYYLYHGESYWYRNGEYYWRPEWHYWR
jgi:hypothetical protein